MRMMGKLVAVILAAVIAWACVDNTATTIAADNALQEEIYVYRQLSEVDVTLISAHNLWEEAFQMSLLKMPYIKPEVCSMTYVLKVSFPSWDNELRSAHLPRVTIVHDGAADRKAMNVLCLREFGRSCQQDSFLITCTVSSDVPLSTEHIRVLVSSGSCPEYAVYQDVFLEGGVDR